MQEIILKRAADILETMLGRQNITQFSSAETLGPHLPPTNGYVGTSLVPHATAVAAMNGYIASSGQSLDRYEASDSGWLEEQFLVLIYISDFQFLVKVALF